MNVGCHEGLDSVAYLPVGPVSGVCRFTFVRSGRLLKLQRGFERIINILEVTRVWGWGGVGDKPSGA